MRSAVKRDMNILVENQMADELKHRQRGLTKAKSVGRNQLQPTTQVHSPFAVTRLVSVRNNGVDEESCLWGQTIRPSFPRSQYQENFQDPKVIQAALFTRSISKSKDRAQGHEQEKEVDENGEDKDGNKGDTIEVVSFDENAEITSNGSSAKM